MSAIVDIALGASNLILVGAVVTGRLETAFRPAKPAATPPPASDPEPVVAAEFSEVAHGATPSLNGQPATEVVRVWRDGRFTDQP